MVQILDDRPAPTRHGAKRAEILRRAAAAFREQGFHAAGMRDIARALGMTPGSLYYYFESKDDLLYECQRQALATLLAGARAAAAREGWTAAQKLEEVVRVHVLCLLEETGGSAAHLEFRALPGPRRAEIAARRDEYERLVRGVVAAGVRRGELRAVDAKLATLALLGALNYTVVWWRPDGDRTPDEIARTFAETWIGGLLP